MICQQIACQKSINRPEKAWITTGWNLLQISRERGGGRRFDTSCQSIASEADETVWNTGFGRISG